ncbi:MAG TPA: glycosyltransferase family 39 protein [Candidatus Polarisedimenticolaceae bacterium]
MDANLRWLYRAVAAAAAFLLLLGLDGSALLDPDEARFARTSVEMQRSGDLVVPTFEGRPRLVKPPLVHWIQAFLFWVAGPGEGVARLHAAIATLGSVLLVGWVARRRFGDEGGIWAMAVFATMPLVFGSGRIGMLDALLSVHVFAAVALDLGTPDRPGAQRGIAIGALAGLAFLAKGPVGPLTILVCMLAGRTLAGRDVWPHRRTAAFTLGAFAAVVLPWGLAFVQRIGFDGVAALLHDEVVQRSLEGTAHVEPPWYFGPVLLLGALPWAGPLLSGLVRLIARRNDPEAQTALQAAGALFAGIVMFSLSRGKQPYYILPLFPLAALVATWEIGQELAYPRRRRWASSFVVIVMVSLAVGLGGASALKLEQDLRPAAAVGAAAFALASIAGLWGLLAARPRLVHGGAAIATAVFLVAAIVSAGGPLSERRSARALVASIPALVDPARPVVLAGARAPSLTWYADRIPEHLETAERVGERLGRGDRALFVIAQADLAIVPAKDRERLRELGRVAKFRVFEEAAIPESPAKAPVESLDRPREGR